MARPSSYQPAYTRQAYHLALLGATDVDLANAFDVDVSTVERWKKKHDEFRRALKRGKDTADGLVSQSLFRRARGYSHKAVKIVADAKTGAEHTVEYIERYPPDTVACIFWLKNRRPDLWRDKQAIEHSNAGNGVLAVPVAPTSEQWAAGASQQQAELTKRPVEGES